jgi:glycosyltransferase involved in cell wall biosynthesis
LVEIGNRRRLAQRISFLIQNSKISDEVGKKARERVTQLCNWKQIAQRIYDIMRRVKG